MKLVRLLLIITCALFISAWIMSDSYLNSHKIPVAIKTSGWIPFFGDDSESMIVLQEGDLYDDGYVYEKYGLIDDINKEFAEQNIKPSRTPYKEINKQLEEECDEFQAAIDNKTLPDNWKCYYRGSYENQCAKLLQKIDILKSSRQSNDEKKTKHLKAEYAFYTNRFSDPKIFEKISDPDFDMDKDGLSNLEEFYSDSDPMVKNSVVIYPTRVKLIAYGSAVCTGVFYVANLTATNISFHLENNYRSSDDRYAPKIVPVDAKFGLSKNGLMFINMPPASKQKFLYLLDSKYLPYCFSTSYGVTACFNNNSTWSDDYIGHINFYMFGNKGHEITKATDLHPKSGSKLQQDNSLYFRWRSGEKNVSIKRAYEIRYVIQFYNVNKKMSFDYFCFTNTWFAPEKNDLNTFSPGLYFWRVIKQDAFSAPFCTDWNWFSIGKKAKDYTSDQNRKKKIFEPKSKSNCGIMYYELYKDVPFDLDICSGKESEKQPLVLKLPKDFEIVFFDNYWHLKGTPHEIGRWTNVWFRVRPEMTFTNKCIFSVYDQTIEDLSCSYYNLEKAAVVHDLTVGHQFEYFLDTCFDILEKDDASDLCKDYSVKISPKLPDGLNLKRTGEKYNISGIPKIDGVFDVEIIYEKARRLKENHVFNIKTSKNPKPIVYSEDWVSVYLSEEPWGSYQYFTVYFKTGMVRHILSNKKDVRYPISLDYLAYGKKPVMLNSYESFFGTKRRAFKKHDEEQTKVELLSPLPGGIELKKENDKYYLDCAPVSLGSFTNHIRIVSMEGVYTNMHIYRILKVKTK